jgi:hypothetical protein
MYNYINISHQSDLKKEVKIYDQREVDERPSARSRFIH